MKTARVLPGVAIMVALAAPGPHAATSNPPKATAQEYSFATYRVKSGAITVLVDSYPASLHRSDAYVPVNVAIGMYAGKHGIAITPESFTLIDSEGHAYPAVSYKELLGNYDEVEFDADLVRRRPIQVGWQFANNLRVEASFYPAVASRRILLNDVYLDPWTWFHTLVYFPRPAAGLRGVLTLQIAGGRLHSPIDVRFRVPLKNEADRS